MRQFEYRKAVTLRDAFDAVSDSKGGAVFMAGGTDLLVKIKKGVIGPKRVIDMKGIPEMDGLSMPLCPFPERHVRQRYAYRFLRQAKGRPQRFKTGQ